MKKETFDSIRKDGRLIYEYIRGSKAYGTSKPDGTSDEDHGGVYMETLDQLLGSKSTLPDEVSNEKHDDVWYRFGRFMELVKKSNPNILESLFIPESCIIYEHPIITELKLHGDKFVTKECFHPFIGYSIKQIERARSLGKKVVPDEQPEPFVIDSVFTFFNQGSTPISKWLSDRGMEQKYCGLVNIPNCTSNLSCFYDWGLHIREKAGVNDYQGFYNYMTGPTDKFIEYVTISEFPGLTIEELWETEFKDVYKYHGIVKDSKEKDSKQVRLSSVKKGEKPVCIISFDPNTYTQRCIKYKEWQDWLACRNEERYSEVKNGDRFDKKNALHSVRLMNMGIEIANGEGVKVDRRGIDADFLLSIRLGNTAYEEMMDYLDKKRKTMEEAMKNSKLPDTIDSDWFEDLIVHLRRKYYGL